MMEPLAVYGKSRSQSNTNLSTTMSLSALDQNGKEIPLQTSPIEFIIPRDPNLLIPPMISHNQSFHYLNITSNLPISVHFEIDPLKSNLSYLFIYKFDQFPVLNSSMQNIDGWTAFCPLNLTSEGLYTYYLDNEQTLNHRFIVFGLRELNSTEFTTPLMLTDRFDFTSNYQLRIYTSGCYYLDKQNQWKPNGLRVGPLTNLQQTHCFSTHLTTFAGGLQVFPPAINLNFVFANADFVQNKTIYLTVIFVTLSYIILIIYARRHDRKDVEKLGVSPLPDNRREDHYYYQIIVFTGQRKDSGTESNVHFVVGGEKDQTSVRTFADPHRKIFQRGGINAFIMAVPKSLGLLNYLHIWHDNSGKDSSGSWFLKYIIIRDLQTIEKFHFIAQRWFAAEKDDGKVIFYFFQCEISFFK